MWPWAKLAQHLVDVIYVVIEVEAAFQERDLTGVGPLGDEHVVVLQEPLHRTAQ